MHGQLKKQLRAEKAQQPGDGLLERRMRNELRLGNVLLEVYDRIGGVLNQRAVGLLDDGHHKISDQRHDFILIA